MSEMTLKELDTWFQNILNIEAFSKSDNHLNGIQVGDLDQKIRRVAFAVDACMESFRRAAAWGAGLLVVHHGMYWGSVYPLTKNAYDRIRYLIESRLALFGVHLPLDAHPIFGNNAVMASEIALQDIRPFGVYKGMEIGYWGSLQREMYIEEISQQLFGEDRATLGRLPFGPEKIRTVGIISGGASAQILDAIELGLDLYITGDADHTIYHRCLEAGINVIFGGHYHTETRGVSALSQELHRQTGLETCFIDVPTGL